MNPIEIEWTRRLISSIARYFRNRKYKVESMIVDGSKIESEEGIDAVVIVGGKILGIQTKRPSEGKITSYKIDEDQHKVIKERDWVYYAFPENIPPEEFKNILHRTLFSRGGFKPKKTIRSNEISDGERWGKIARDVGECTAGRKIEKDEDKEGLYPGLSKLIEDYLAIFSINPEEERIKVSVGYGELLDGRVFRDKIKDKSIRTKKRVKDETEEKKSRKKVKCPICGTEFVPDVD